MFIRILFLILYRENQANTPPLVLGSPLKFEIREGVVNMAKKEQPVSDRAVRYARALVAFQEVGAGPDRNLGKVYTVKNAIQFLCKDETGVELESYPRKVAKYLMSNEVG